MANAYQNHVPTINGVNAGPGIQEKLQGLYAIISMSVDEKKYQETFSIFAQAQKAYDAHHEGPKPDCGSVESNVVEHIFCDIASLASESLNCQVSARRDASPDGCQGPHMLAREVEADDVGLAIAFAHKSLEFSGIADRKRFFGHYRRAVAYANMGDYMTELNTVVPEPERTELLSGTVPAWNDAARSYRCAAQDAFFAVHVAGATAAGVPQTRVDTICALHSQACGKLGINAYEHFAQMHRAGLARLQLPALGLWEGDPTLSEYWGPYRMMLMALFRRREHSDIPTAADLWDELEKLKITWVHDEGGQISLEGLAGAHMTPTLVVPDNTRDGLRAAGLYGDKFEMARR